jgi:hypothetical protein
MKPVQRQLAAVEAAYLAVRLVCGEVAIDPVQPVDRHLERSLRKMLIADVEEHREAHHMLEMVDQM